MFRDIVLLAVGAFFGLGATMTATVAPTYLPNMPPWAVHWLFWGGIAIMSTMLIDGLFLLAVKPNWTTATLFNSGLFLLSGAIINHVAPTLSQKDEVLRRLIAYGRLDLIIPWNENSPQFQGNNIGVQNVSNDTITAWVKFVNADIDGTQIMTSSAPSSPVIIPQTQGTLFQSRRTSPENQPISLDANTITVEFEVDYDTIPESGVRRSYRKIAYHLNWVNGKKSAPLLEPKTLDEWER